MAGDEPALDALTPGARLVVAAALRDQATRGTAALGTFHWLLALVERHRAMLADLSPSMGTDGLRASLDAQLRAGSAGDPLPVAETVRQAHARATARGRSIATERDLAATVLAAAGYALAESAPPDAARSASTAGEGAAVPTAATYRPRARRPTPALDKFGRDLTRAALDGALAPMIGREAELRLVIETLCRRTKRNPVLVGPAGVGKTAIVEGLAQRIVTGDVPSPLQGARLVALQPSTLVAGASMAGEFEERIQAALGEASQEGLLLFVDEVHALIGAGGRGGTADAASLFKPVLARGDLACIAATTDVEYRRYIEADSALERRFQPIRVQEPTAGETLAILTGLRDDFARRRGVAVDDAILAWLVEFADRYLRNRHFPDKAVDLLDQCVAYAVTQGKAALDAADARAVAQRMVGMPLDLGERLAGLRALLAERAPLPAAEAEALLSRLAVAARGLDVNPARPNATVLLLGPAAGQGPALAAVVAEALAGAPDRIVAIDFSGFADSFAVTKLIGSPPGYVGYEDALPLDRIAQLPWCVVLGRNVDACHLQVRAVLTQALATGVLTDARGRQVFLSDTVVVLTATEGGAPHRHLGFGSSPEDDTPARAAAVEALLGDELAGLCDVICVTAAAAVATRAEWLERHLLKEVADRYRQQGLAVRWDKSLVAWLLEQPVVGGDQRGWERLIDERVSPLLVPHLPTAAGGEVRALVISFEDTTIRIAADEEESHARHV